MSFNLTKYENVKFHKDDLTNKRIKALLLWFEYEVHKNDLTLENQILLLNRWLEKLIKEEYYEVLPFFKAMKADMEEKIKNPKHATISDVLISNDTKPVIKSTEKDNLVVKTKKESFLSRIKKKLTKWYKK